MLTRNLGINYILCCKIVLMFYNGKYKISTGIKAATARTMTNLNKW